MGQGPLPASVRLYESVRTAHLERAHETSAAAIVYRVKRYDFDREAAKGLRLVQASRLRAALLLFRSRTSTLEINEPLMASSLPATALALAALSARRMRGIPPARIVAYAIGNSDPFAAPPRRLRSRFRRIAERALSRFVWNRIDRIAFGTEAARRTYAILLGEPRGDSTVVPALPTPWPGATTADPPTPGGLLFVGALSDRKGIRVLLDAWRLVAEDRPEARLTIVGTGSLEGLVREATERLPRLTLVVDPPRQRIHAELDDATALVLPSQPSGTWREQVGLPIVEALSHGCTVVTTPETGLADWLAAEGHIVIDDAGSAIDLARGIRKALDDPLPRDRVLASLPDRDGRLAADDWLFA